MATTVTLKPNAIDLSGSTSGTTTLQATAVAGTTTITLPAATDTLVGKATTDTLTNKTLTTPVISTISNTGTLTLPTSTDTLVGRATTDTLTNKTLTTPTISSLSSASATALTLQSAGTTAITVNTSQNVGIGTTSPSYKLDVSLASSTSGIVARFNSPSYDELDFYVGSSKAYIGTAGGTPLAFQTNNTESMRIDTSGNLLVGTTSASGNEKFNVTTSSDKVALFKQSADTNAYNGIHVQIGSAQNNTSSYHFRGETRGVANYYLYGNGTTSYSSDSRLKKNIVTTRNGYLEDLNKLRVVKYQWLGDNPDCQQVELGLIAQEVEEVFPNLVQEHEIEGVGMRKNIKQSVLPFMMLKAIQELKAINDTQAETINALTARIVALEAK